MKYPILLISLLLFISCTNTAATEAETPVSDNASVLEKSRKSCGDKGLWLQVLGSGGPELTDKRASTSYLLWVDGKSRILIDAGSGSAVHFEKVGADYSELEMILLSHLHVDHSADLPAYLKGSFFVGRKNDLLVIGPPGNQRMPAIDDYIQRLFASGEGAYQYLGDFLPQTDVEQSSSYAFEGQVYQDMLESPQTGLKIRAVAVKHGPIPALAWRIDAGEKSVVFSGDMSQGGEDFIQLLDSSNLFVAHNAIPETAGQAAKNLHMTPRQIGAFAKRGKVQSLLLSHRMSRTLGSEPETLAGVKESYHGEVRFANDLDCYEL